MFLLVSSYFMLHTLSASAVCGCHVAGTSDGGCWMTIIERGDARETSLAVQ